MLFGDIPLVGMLKQRMSWHQERQGVLAENVANADTPNYRARDLRAPVFGEMAQAAGRIQMAATSPMHLSPQVSGGADAHTPKTYEITPEGNAVVIEEEVMRVSQNVIDYQMVSQLYTRGLGVLKTAIGRRA